MAVNFVMNFFNFIEYSHFNWLELILFAQASLNISDPQDRDKVGTAMQLLKRILDRDTTDID